MLGRAGFETDEERREKEEVRGPETDDLIISIQTIQRTPRSKKQSDDEGNGQAI